MIRFCFSFLFIALTLLSIKSNVVGHADRKKSAVSSTPVGVLVKHNGRDNPLVNPNEWCGPFSVARQMIAEREQARRLREEEQEELTTLANHPLDEVMHELEMDRKRRAHPSLQWKGTQLNDTSGGGCNSGNIYSKRQKRTQVLLMGKKVPSLLDMVVTYLLDNFEHVEALGDVDSSIRALIAKELVAQNKLDSQAFKAIAEVGVEALELVDCSGITQEDLCFKLRELLPAGLKFLALDQAGRCFGPKVVEALVQTNSSLFALSVGGAYLLKDSDAAEMIGAVSKTVTSLEFKACPLLGHEFANALRQSFSSPNEILELVLEDLSLGNESLETMIAKPEWLQSLKSIRLCRIKGLTDELVDKILEHAGPTLESVDLSENHDLTDATLASIRRYCSGARSLSLSGLKHLTSQGLEALFLHVHGQAPPPMLRTLNLGKCDYEAVTDEVVDLVMQASTRMHESEGDEASNRAFAPTSSIGGVVNLDIQGSSEVTDTSMEFIAATCGSSLVEINLSFCTKVTDKGLGYLTDRCANQFSKVSIWGCAQLSDDFLDGHRRVGDPCFDIAGAWMKKTSSRTMR
jgi:hypothetical protein